MMGIMKAFKCCHDGNNKSFKVLLDVVSSGCISIPWGFLLNDDPGLTMTIFDRVKVVS